MDRTFFLPQALEVAPRLLGMLVSVASGSSRDAVTLRITEVEAYHGLGTVGPYDAGSHAKRARTNRNASMFGPPGYAYVYFTYGMHHALNLVCGPEGVASGVLIRAGEIVHGQQLAYARRLAKRRQSNDPDQTTPDLPAHVLARGPGNVATALGLTREAHDGLDLFAAPFALDRPQPDQLVAEEAIKSGPRVGVAGASGGPEFPWRFWVDGEPTVSNFRPGRGAPR